jgi:hypothetical protein
LGRVSVEPAGTVAVGGAAVAELVAPAVWLASRVSTINGVGLPVVLGPAALALGANKAVSVRFGVGKTKGVGALVPGRVQARAAEPSARMRIRIRANVVPSWR